jgi:hypothetical protein
LTHRCETSQIPSTKILNLRKKHVPMLEQPTSRISKRSLVNEHVIYARMTPDELMPLLRSRMHSERAAAAVMSDKAESTRIVIFRT